ncbi:hypothetical protein JMN11_02435 [Capnocytophaga genosp. AHN8471]|uniref:Lipoprotein n=1 Tax=Capnocytophaga periodontitidis TaxID=2795027 RepID=A0ABS0SNK3_9FLAO|nr:MULTISPECIES: hypothetical protein [Capnocytophaga]MBI1647122.1 hypothetical protein [Capnocytophaga periodontitidis]MBM0652536.1 hypothetical protein [Capnocytophaga genosp. AHN8471]
MKKLSIVAVMAIAMVACNNTNSMQTTQTETTEVAPSATEEMPPVGGNRDTHGCIGSAGQSWSELLQECVQVFEVGTRLNPVEVNMNDAIISAFIVAKEGDNSQVELFITTEETNPLLKQQKDGTYKNGKYAYNPKTQELSIDGKVAYKGEKTKM